MITIVNVFQAYFPKHIFRKIFFKRRSAKVFKMINASIYLRYYVFKNFKSN
jgi:hypothetical protein